MESAVIALGIFGGACTAITAWIVNGTRKSRDRTPSTPDALPRSAHVSAAAAPPPPGSPTLAQRLVELDEAWLAGVLTTQEYTWRRSVIVSLA